MKIRRNVLRLILVGVGALALTLTVFSFVLDRIIASDVRDEMRMVLKALCDVDAHARDGKGEKCGAELLLSCCREWPKFFDGFVLCLSREGDEIVASASPCARAGDRAGDIIDNFDGFRKHALDELFIACVYGTRSHCLMLAYDAYLLVAVVPSAAISGYRDVPLLAFGLVVFVLVTAFTFGAIRRSELLRRLKGYIDGEKLRMTEDLSSAQLVQMSALPPPYPPQPAFTVHARMDPAKIVGGDFYDYQALPNGGFYFLVADVSGKGISAAMFMMRAKSVIKQCLAETEDLSKGMTKANAMLVSQNDSKIFVTVWVGVLNPRTGRVRYVNAGHNPPIIMRKGDATPSLEWVKCPPSLVLGLLPNVRYPVHELTLSPEDTLFLYTDGVTEAQDPAGHLYGEKRLMQVLSATGGFCVENVRDDLDLFQGKAEPSDDVTMVALKYNGTPPGSARGFPCTREGGFIESVKFLESELTRVACPADVRTKFLVAYDEIASNVVNYSGAEYFTIKVAFESTPQAITLTVTDTGTPFDPLEKSAPDLNQSLEKRASGGFGIYIARQLMDDVIYCRDENMNVLTLRKLCRLD